MGASLVPRAPVHSAIDKTVQTNVTIVMGVIAVAVLIFALVYYRRTGRPTFLVLFVAGGAMMLMEPMVDTVCDCWFPRVNSWVAFTLWGRPMPVWLCLAYFVYFGLGVGTAWVLMRRGLTAGRLWALLAAVMAGDVALETTLLHWHTWIYYGHQPLVVARFPLWCAAVNAMIVIVTAAVVHRCDGYLTGRRQLLIVPVALTTSACMNAAVGWPAFLAINSDLGWGGRQAAGLATFALAFWVMSVVVRFTAVPGTIAASAGHRAESVVTRDMHGQRQTHRSRDTPRTHEI